MSSRRRVQPRRQFVPDVYFLPLALPDPKQVPGLDVGVVCRRVPDFLHHLVNATHGDPALVAMLDLEKLQTLETGEAFALLPGEEVRSLVTGTLQIGHDGFELETRVHFRPDSEPVPPVRLRASVDVRNPVPALARLAGRVDEVLELGGSGGGGSRRVRELLTGNTRAFYKLLEALDGRPVFAEVLSMDPGFGLALRIVRSRMAAALGDGRGDLLDWCSVLDGCLQARPLDGEACVQVAELLQRLGEEERARAWLEHAVSLAEPPAGALEALGGLLLEQGHPQRARELWQRGVELDGHTDFCAHLARLAFSEGNVWEAWAHVEQGLRRVSERAARCQEWVAEWEEDRPDDLLLRCVAEQLERYPPPEPPEAPEAPEVPEDVAALLVGLCGRLRRPEERVELGVCLLGLDRAREARAELQGALAMDLELGARDRAVRAMLVLDVPDFERRFAAAVKSIQGGGNPRRGMRAMRVMHGFLIRQPEFWPGLFYLAVGFRRQDRQDDALDALAEVLEVCPGQVETLVEMAELFAARGNPKRALECVEEALGSCDRDDRGDREAAGAGLHLRRAEYLEQLGRPEAAAEAARQALDPAKASGAWA